jgi:hypothetical protein
MVPPLAWRPGVSHHRRRGKPAASLGAGDWGPRAGRACEEPAAVAVTVIRSEEKNGITRSRVMPEGKSGAGL